MDKNREKCFDEKVGKYYINEGLLQGIKNNTYFSGGDTSYYDPSNTIQTNLSPEAFKRNVDGYNIRSACEWLHSHSGRSSQHACAKFVRSAIDVGFGTNPNSNSYTGAKGRPNWAWKYINFLPKIGFKFIGKISRNQQASFRPEPGDIAVYQNAGNPNVPGHICMWTSAGWESDFKQNNMIVYSRTNEAYVFRFA